RHSLPDLIARLVAGPYVHTFPRIAAEQRGHWWRFLVRCAARAFHASGWSVEEARSLQDSQLASVVRDVLRAAAGDPDGSRQVWALHQPDPTQPGFLQPPVPDGGSPAQARYSPNSLSLLTSAIGSKSHERKVDLARELDPEQTVYALIEFQLGAVFGGRG